MENEDFNDFIKQSNVAGRILIAHFIAIQIMVSPIIDREWAGRNRSTPLRCNLSWVNFVEDELPANKRHFIDWPRAIAESVEEELQGKQSPVPKVSILRRKEGFNVRAFWSRVVEGDKMEDWYTLFMVRAISGVGHSLHGTRHGLRKNRTPASGSQHVSYMVIWQSQGEQNTPTKSNCSLA